MNDENKKGERLTHHKLFKAKKIHQTSKLHNPNAIAMRKKSEQRVTMVNDTVDPAVRVELSKDDIICLTNNWSYYVRGKLDANFISSEIKGFSEPVQVAFTGLISRLKEGSVDEEYIVHQNLQFGIAHRAFDN